ncbi:MULTISPECIES: dihydroxyacetone kinase family protein [Micromonospora]|uniref:D-erythrulose kinase n=1 Tax=Micromonospora sicca TaxID=2202420 RepID=A0A317DDC6_9ACTN|nr:MULTISPECIES: dihydroxyacetone kinase family protein [unclassified Micromonospora]MBM0225381.1 dihydroxyacetone kinase family protein [Micromonospora sp. ATA51]PWR11756.1 D-erythrulose kinase [Micromonospora sp. 4G51]
MTRLVNVAPDFAGEALEGFVAVHREHVIPVHGGVVRASATPAGRVTVVLGGGSGHYPAFAGWVGPGFAHGAVCGNIFASPSASQVYSVARAADAGGGIILGFGNYAGDVLHFGQAAERLRAEGIDVRTLAVTDDIVSAPPQKRDQRRGVAGNMIVFKIACGAAEDGLDLDAVEAIGRCANDATFSFGVAFDGCTLPGAGHPLFTVEPGHMAIGLGIHGEPGIGKQRLLGADELADLLVGEVLDGAGASRSSGRVAVLVNGLGSVKYEELFVVYRRVAHQLGKAGLTIVRPTVGEQVTSLNMSGLSLTVTFLDDDLEKYWVAPADAPAFHRGPVSDEQPRRVLAVAGPARRIQPGSPASRACAARVARAMAHVRDVVLQHEARLGEIDAVAGDGDHGIGMARGTAAAAEAAEVAADERAGVRGLLIQAAEAWSERAGGTSGALWGAALTAAAGTLDDENVPTPDDIVRATGAAVATVMRLGGAEPGDKTLVDAAVPFAQVLEARTEAGTPFGAAWSAAAHAATQAAEATAHIPARLGRARTHGDGSIGTPDAGAVSFALIVSALAVHFATDQPREQP